MQAEIVAIGTELLLGATVDTNSAYLAQQLATVGVPVQRVTLVRDDWDEIAGVLQAAQSRVDLVVCSGGLGPTGDDLTREAIATALDQPLEFHQALLDEIAARFAAFKRPMSDSNRQQAYVPRGAYIIRNPHGTAPAFVAERDGKLIAALPGVPQELHYLTENGLLPYLREQHGLHETLIVREIHLSGITEAEAGERIADMILGVNPVVGITAKRGQHTIRIAATGADQAAAEALIAPLVDQIRQRFGDLLLGNERLEDSVGRMLAERGVRINLIENDVQAPVYRALAQTTGGRHALDQITIDPTLPLDQSDPRRSLVALARQNSAAQLTMLVYIEPTTDAFRNAHVLLGQHALDQVQHTQRGIDSGLPQAHDFVATMALEALRRWLKRPTSHV